MLIVVNRQDHLVNPSPAIEFAKLTAAKLLIVDNAGGHNGIDFADANFKKEVQDILSSTGSIK